MFFPDHLLSLQKPFAFYIICFPGHLLSIPFAFRTICICICICICTLWITFAFAFQIICICSLSHLLSVPFTFDVICFMTKKKWRLASYQTPYTGYLFARLMSHRLIDCWHHRDIWSSGTVTSRTKLQPHSKKRCSTYYAPPFKLQYLCTF